MNYHFKIMNMITKLENLKYVNLFSQKIPLNQHQVRPHIEEFVQTHSIC